jgi:hypothetical protein
MAASGSSSGKLSRRGPLPFRRVHPAWFVALDGGVAALAVLSASGRAHRAVEWWLPVPDQRNVRRLLGGTVALHAAEASAAFLRARRAGTGRRTAGAWAAQTFVVGFPSLLAQNASRRSAAAEAATAAEPARRAA